MSKISFTFASLLIFAGCNETLIKNASNSSPILNISSIGFDDVNREIFQARCISCHGNSGGINLQSYDNIKSNITRIQAAISSGRMPPGNPLSGRQKKLLDLWISKGTPLAPVPVDMGDGGLDDGGTSPQLPPLSATYSSLKEHLFNARCIVCHDGNTHDAPSLKTRSEIIDPDLGIIDFNRPSRSLLIQVIKNRTNNTSNNLDDDDNLQMPPPNSGIGPVPLEQIQMLEEWIRRGAPE